MTRRGGLQEVELLDDDEESPASSPAARRRIPLVPVVAGVLVLLVGLAGTQWFLTARERAAVAALAQVPGVIAPVDENLVVERRVAAEAAPLLYGRSAGSLVRAPDGAQTYTWVDGADGGTGWTAELLGPSAALARVASWHVVAGSTCVEDVAPSERADAATRVVCLVSDGALVIDATGGGSLDRVPATTREVVVLSTADGSELARWAVAAGESLAVLPDDVVAVASGSPTDTTLTAYDALTGERRWTHVDPLPDGFTYEDDDMLAVSMFRTHDLLAYFPPGGALMLLSPDGRVVRNLSAELTDYLGVGWSSDEDGRITLQSGGGDSLRTTVLAADGDPEGDITVDGNVIAAGIDDGSVPGLLLSSGDAVHAWDERTGEARWSSHVRGRAQSALVMRGRVFLATSTGVVALDGATGATLWATEPDRTTTVGWIFTDAHHLLVTLEPTSPDDEPVLAAYDPSSGHEDFRAPYPDGVSMVLPAGRTLVGLIEATNEYAVLG